MKIRKKYTYTSEVLTYKRIMAVLIKHTQLNLPNLNLKQESRFT